MRGSSLLAVGGRIVIGDRVFVNSNVLIDASDGGVIEISDDVLIGPNVVLRASDHDFERTDNRSIDRGIARDTSSSNATHGSPQPS